jgi:hypothetical protein
MGTQGNDFAKKRHLFFGYVFAVFLFSLFIIPFLSIYCVTFFLFDSFSRYLFSVAFPCSELSLIFFLHFAISLSSYFPPPPTKYLSLQVSLIPLYSYFYFINLFLLIFASIRSLVFVSFQSLHLPPLCLPFTLLFFFIPKQPS